MTDRVACRWCETPLRPWEPSTLAHYERHIAANTARRLSAGLRSLGWGDMADEALERAQRLESVDPAPVLACDTCRRTFPNVHDLTMHTVDRHGRQPSRTERTPRRAA